MDSGTKQTTSNFEHSKISKARPIGIQTGSVKGVLDLSVHMLNRFKSSQWLKSLSSTGSEYSPTGRTHAGPVEQLPVA